LTASYSPNGVAVRAPIIVCDVKTGVRSDNCPTVKLEHDVTVIVSHLAEQMGWFKRICKQLGKIESYI